MLDIGLFQNQRNWEAIKEQVMIYLDQDHNAGRAQNGELTDILEQRLADHFNRKYCVTTASCTDALVISIIASDLKPNSKVAVPNYTFTATAHAVARAGYTVVPVDVGRDYCIDVAEIPPVDAIIGVDMFGNMCNWEKIQALGLPTINDAAQSIESHDGTRYSAGYGDVACLSFSPTKTISSWGSGGAILTDNKRIADKARKLRLHGKQNNNASAIHPGLNSMMSSFECACVLAGLNHSKEWQHRRNRIAGYISERSRFKCASVHNLRTHTHSKLVFQSKDRDSVQKLLNQKEINTAIHYNLLINEEPLYRGGKILPISKRLSEISFTVPNQHTLTDAEVERLGKNLK